MILGYCKTTNNYSSILPANRISYNFCRTFQHHISLCSFTKMLESNKINEVYQSISFLRYLIFGTKLVTCSLGNKKLNGLIFLREKHKECALLKYYEAFYVRLLYSVREIYCIPPSQSNI